MIQGGSDVDVSAAGAGGSMMFYSKVIGLGGWSPQTVAPAGSVG
jgi:hypothetical protein